MVSKRKILPATTMHCLIKCTTFYISSINWNARKSQTLKQYIQESVLHPLPMQHAHDHAYSALIQVCQLVVYVHVLATWSSEARFAPAVLYIPVPTLLSPTPPCHTRHYTHLLSIRNTTNLQDYCVPYQYIRSRYKRNIILMLTRICTTLDKTFIMDKHTNPTCRSDVLSVVAAVCRPASSGQHQIFASRQCLG